MYWCGVINGAAIGAFLVLTIKEFSYINLVTGCLFVISTTIFYYRNK